MYLGIVDADSILYRVAYSCKDDSLEVAKDTLRAYVFENIYKPTRCEQYCFCFSGKQNFRKDVAVTKPYKGNRVQEKPLHLEELRNYAIEEYLGVVIEPFEADDLVIALADRYIGAFVLIGIDKDGLQLTGFHYNFVKQEWLEVLPIDAQYNLARQLLTGDSVDNITGIPKIGKVKAEKILDADEPPMLTAYNAYKQLVVGDYDAYFLEQLTLLKMKKDILYPFEKHFMSFKNSGYELDIAEEFDFE